MTTPEGPRKLDHLPPLEALAEAWSTPGPHPSIHLLHRRMVRDAMPLVARALDRLADDNPTTKEGTP